MEIAGSTCAVCGQHVIFAQDGKCCPACGIVVHEKCDDQSRCSRCGRAYERQEHPIPDPLRDATVPRSLRPSALGASVPMLIFASLLFLVLLVVLRMLMGH
jgi:hypothetical protein